MIDGDTKLIAHIGYPTATFRAPLIYNPWFRRRGINAAVVPLGVTAKNFREAFPQICRFTNFHGAKARPRSSEIAAPKRNLLQVVAILTTCPPGPGRGATGKCGR
jgi:hypothetical protein